MWDINYKIQDEQVIAVITLEDGFEVDDGISVIGEDVHYHIYTATRGGTPSQPISKSTPFHIDSSGKLLELQLKEGGVKRKVKKTRENVSNAKKK